MVDFKLPISKNPLKTKKDLQDAFIQLTKPLINFYSPGFAQLKLGNTGAAYPEQTSFLEGFSRVLWGLGPFLSGGGESELEKLYLEGIKNGTNPEHEEYWGDVPSHDQRIVEMAAIGFALALAPEKFWEPLSTQEKSNFSNWLNAINHSSPYTNNWLFFRAMVDLGLAAAGREYDKDLLEKTLDTLDTFYRGDGWYSDGNKPQFDYYIPFAMHFYGLIYGKLTGESKYLERAKLFARDFIYWFSSHGDSLPFGRSLTYKFAQTAFWCAYVYAGAPAKDLGMIKGIIMRHLRWWFSQPIFDRDGILSIGYAYPNLIMSEGYNSPGSQYWALKSFLILDLPNDHPFWEIEEAPLPELNPLSVQNHPKMLFQRMENGKHIVALTSGQYADFKPSGVEAKYSKFAYSNVFGFSISRSNTRLSQGAFDSMLALSEDGADYRVRECCEQVKITENAIYSIWKPWKDVEIKTVLIPVGGYHVRVHKITTGRSLTTVECGFSAAIDDTPGAFQQIESEGAFCVSYPNCSSGIIDLTGSRSARLQANEVNTNILHPRTTMPVLDGNIEKGEAVIACAVLGGIEKDYCQKLWQSPPKINIADEITVIHQGKTLTLKWEL